NTELLHLVGNELQHFMYQLAFVDFAFAAKIDQLAVKSVARGSPAVFVNQAPGIVSKRDVLLSQLVQLEHDCLHQCSQRDGVIYARLRIADAEFNGVEKRMQPDVPPNLLRVVNAAG